MKKLFWLVWPLLFSAAVMANPDVQSTLGNIERFGRHFGWFIGLGLAAFGVGIGQGIAANSTIQGISRNPSAAGQLITPMILAFAFMESLLIFVIISIYILK